MNVINNGAIGRQVNIAGDGPLNVTIGLSNRRPLRWQYLVVIVREGVPEVTGFNDIDDATAFCHLHGAQWSDSYLCNVVKGPVI
jgi:hypothetical protein